MTVSETKITRPGLLVMGIGAAALIGWGAFAYSGESRAAVERELRAKIQQTEAERARRLEDLMQLKQELARLFPRLVTASTAPSARPAISHAPTVPGQTSLVRNLLS